MVSKISTKNIETDLTEDELRNIYAFLSSFFIGLLKPVKPNDLEYYINKMTTFNIRPYFNRIPKQLRQRLSEMAQNNRDLVNNLLNGDMLIDQAQKNRPDLYEVLITYKGKIWLSKFMLYIQKLLLTL